MPPKKVADVKELLAYKGRHVFKIFPAYGEEPFHGVVTAVNPEAKWPFYVVYDDNDNESMTLGQLLKHVKPADYQHELQPGQQQEQDEEADVFEDMIEGSGEGEGEGEGKVADEAGADPVPADGDAAVAEPGEAVAAAAAGDDGGANGVVAAEAVAPAVEDVAPPKVDVADEEAVAEAVAPAEEEEVKQAVAVAGSSKAAASKSKKRGRPPNPKKKDSGETSKGTVKILKIESEDGDEPATGERGRYKPQAVISEAKSDRTAPVPTAKPAATATTAATAATASGAAQAHSLKAEAGARRAGGGSSHVPAQAFDQQATSPAPLVPPIAHSAPNSHPISQINRIPSASPLSTNYPAFSKGVVWRDVLYSSLLTPRDEGPDGTRMLLRPDQQLAELLTQVDDLLELAGSSKDKLLQVRVYVKSSLPLPTLAAVYNGWLGDGGPVREAPALTWLNILPEGLTAAISMEILAGL